MKSLSSIEIMRILVLVAAVLLWLNVYGLQNRQMVLVAPVEITGLSPFHGVIEPITGIEVKLSGNARSLAGVNQNTLNFVIDLSNAEGVGEHNAEVKLNQSPPGVDIISFSPTHLTLTVNDRAEKVVPVNVSLKGSVADGYHVAGSTLANKYVTISGAGDLLEFISEAFVQIDLDNQSKSFSTVADVIVVDSQNRHIYNIDVIPQTLAVEVNVAVGVATRTLGLTPHFVGELPGGYWVKEVIFDPAVVTIGGDDGTLKALTLIETTPIKLSNKRESFYESVGVSLPSNINVVGEGIISAHIIVERSLATKQLNIVPQFENVGDGFSVTSIEPATVRVVLSGEASALEKLTRTDVVLKINLEGVLSGVSSLALKSDMFTTGPSVSVVSFDPDNIEVILSRLE
jgi:YbbR domain-containing protein